MQRSNRRLRLHLKSAQEQLKAHNNNRRFKKDTNAQLKTRRRESGITFLEHEISWVKAQQKLNKKNRYGSPLHSIGRYQ